MAREVFLIAGGVASAFSLWPLSNATENYGHYQFLKNVVLPKYEAHPEWTTGTESFNQVARRIKDVEMPLENANFWINTGIGATLLIIAVGCFLAARKR